MRRPQRVKSFVPLMFVLSFWGHESRAQIVPDSTLPVNSQVAPGCTACTIEGGTVRGSNLFHSFEQFSIPGGGSAIFNNPLTIQNIITRVTGATPSNINGVLGASGFANLFLLNPNGIIFGPTAQLKLGGSLFATSANRVDFLNGGSFYVNPQETSSLLTNSVPVGLGFLDPGPVLVQGTTGHQLIAFSIGAPLFGAGKQQGLSVAPGRSITLIGGNTTLDKGVLNAPSGRIEIAAVKEGQVQFGSGSDYNYSGVTEFGDILLTNRALADTTGFGLGTTRLQARNIRIDFGAILLEQNIGSAPSGDFKINATESFVLSGTDPIARAPGGLYSYSLGGGAGGDILISSPQTTLKEGASLTTGSALTVEPVGSIMINASDFLEVNGVSPRDARIQTLLASITNGQSRAGNLVVNAGTVRVVDGGLINSLANGKNDGGNGGDILINANTVEVTGFSPQLFRFSFISSSTTGSGNAGSVEINASVVNLSNRGRIDSSTVSSGNAGSISVNADTINITGIFPESGFSQISSTGDILAPDLTKVLGIIDPLSGNAGSVSLKTRNLRIADGGAVTVQNKGSGDAGTLRISAENIQLVNRGAITAETRGGDGGSIEINNSGLLSLRDSTITTSAQGDGNGGSIAINTRFSVLNNSLISANAELAFGGQVGISAIGVFASLNSVITATSGSGPQFDGIIQINTADIDLSRSGIQAVADPTVPQVVSTCGVNANNQVNSFTVTGAGGLPANPNDFLGSLEGWRDNTPIPAPVDQPSNENLTEVQPIIEAQGWIRTSEDTVRFVTNPTQTTEYYADTSARCEKLPRQAGI